MSGDHNYYRGQDAFPVVPDMANIITFSAPKFVLTLSDTGFHYNGETVSDCGEAYKLFREWLALVDEQDKANAMLRQVLELFDQETISIGWAEKATALLAEIKEHLK